jgi:hypothetical protein
MTAIVENLFESCWYYIGDIGNRHIYLVGSTLLENIRLDIYRTTPHNYHGLSQA